MGKNKKVILDNLEPEVSDTVETSVGDNDSEESLNEVPAASTETENAETKDAPVEQPAFVPEVKEVTVKCARLNVRALPDKTSRVVTTLDNGTTVKVKTLEDPAWYEYTGFGFIMSEYVK